MNLVAIVSYASGNEEGGVVHTAATSVLLVFALIRALATDINFALTVCVTHRSKKSKYFGSNMSTSISWSICIGWRTWWVKLNGRAMAGMCLSGGRETP